jgi:hypothetical protein
MTRGHAGQHLLKCGAVRRGRTVGRLRGYHSLGYAKMLARNYPGVRVKPSQSLVMSRAAQRILTAGGSSSRQDLAL